MDAAELVEAARTAFLEAAIDAYEDAGIRGLCGEGRWEYAMDAVRRLELGYLVPAAPRSAARGEAAK